MTDEDKNLLELAAKAAGFEAGWVIQGWNPITDDGDALRLAVKLRILINPDSGYTNAINDLGGDFSSMHSNHDGDAMAATRRAIVRAASSIGGKL